MITEKRVIGKIEILEDGTIQIREDRVILEDDVEIARVYHRRVLSPGDDISNEIDKRIQDVTSAIWTVDVVDTFKAQQEIILQPGVKIQ